MIQVIRRGAESWEITRVSKRDEVHEFEPIGWVRRDGDLYYAYFPLWKGDEIEWDKQPRGYLLPRAAVRAVTDRKETKKVMQ